jgi:hypothetical protein
MGMLIFFSAKLWRHCHEVRSLPLFVGECGLITAVHFYDKCSSKQFIVKKKQLWPSWGEFYKMVNFHVLQKESDFDTRVEWVG